MGVGESGPDLSVGGGESSNWSWDDGEVAVVAAVRALIWRVALAIRASSLSSGENCGDCGEDGDGGDGDGGDGDGDGEPGEMR